MGVILSPGTEAGPDALKYVFTHKEEAEREGVTFWVRGRGEVLTSKHYASCVGMVLYGDVAGYGAVAHFWSAGSQDLNKTTSREEEGALIVEKAKEQAREITDSYMRWLYEKTGGFAGDDVEAVVFGGNSKGERTESRMNVIKKYLQERWDMRVIVMNKGSKQVKLHLDLPRGDVSDRVELDYGFVNSRQQNAVSSAKSNAKSANKSGRPRANSTGL